MENRRRLSIDLPNKEFNELNDLMEGLRLKNEVFKQLTVDIIKTLRPFNPAQRRTFLIAIASGRLKLEEWHPIVKTLRSNNETRTFETITPPAATGGAVKTTPGDTQE